MHVTNKIRSLSPMVYALNGGMGLEYNAEFSGIAELISIKKNISKSVATKFYA